MKVIIAGGGTAGHINPAITIADLLLEQLVLTKEDITFIGTKRGMENDLVPRAGYQIKHIKVRGLNKKFSLDTIRSLFSLLIGMVQARKIIKKIKPDIVIGTGGYVSGPLLYWAGKLHIPSFIHEQNAYPGMTNKILSKYVDVCAISFEESRKYFSKCKKVILTGNPLRDDILSLSREQCRKELAIKNEEKLVVVMGGSLGALAINDAMIELINHHYIEGEFKLIYAPGKRYYEDVINQVENKHSDIEIKDYIYNGPVVYNSADIVIARAGAMTISEMTAIGIPTILIPSANVAENHQEKNARAIEKKGACKVILDSELDGEVLYKEIKNMLADDSQYKEMKKCAYSIGIRDSKSRLKDVAKILVGGKK